MDEKLDKMSQASAASNKSLSSLCSTFSGRKVPKSDEKSDRSGPSSRKRALERHDRRDSYDSNQSDDHDPWPSDRSEEAIYTDDDSSDSGDSSELGSDSEDSVEDVGRLFDTGKIIRCSWDSALLTEWTSTGDRINRWILHGLVFDRKQSTAFIGFLKHELQEHSGISLRGLRAQRTSMERLIYAHWFSDDAFRPDATALQLSPDSIPSMAPLWLGEQLDFCAECGRYFDSMYEMRTDHIRISRRSGGCETVGTWLRRQNLTQRLFRCKSAVVAGFDVARRLDSLAEVESAKQTRIRRDTV